jgi:hypothetical protein
MKPAATGARGLYRVILLVAVLGLSALFTAGAVVVARGGAAAVRAADRYAGMPDPAAMNAPRVVRNGEAAYTIGATRLRVTGPRRMYRIETDSGRIAEVRLARFGVAVFRAADQAQTFDGQQFIRIERGQWAGWWVKAPETTPTVTRRYNSADVQLSRGLHNGVLFYANGRVRSRLPVYLATTATFKASHRATFEGRAWFLLTDGPLAGRWVGQGKGVDLLAAGAQLSRLSDANATPGPTSVPSDPQASPGPTDQLAPLAEPARPAQSSAALAATWRAVVLLYPATDVTYTRSDGSDYHINVSMSGQMHDLVLDTVGRFQASVNAWSGGLARMDLDVVEVPHPVTSLDALGSNYWVGPNAVEADLNQYAPVGTYDSVFVVWQARDANETIPTGGWGLTLPPGAWANGAGYSSIITPSDMWWWTDSRAPEEVFVHEWMHQVVYWNESQDRLHLDLHAGAQYGYQAVNGTWQSWLSDVMQGNVWDTDHFTGVNAEMWAAGQPTAP